MYELLKKIFPKDYIKANELFDSKDIEANFKLLLYTKFVNTFLYFIYFYFAICLVWSIGFLFGYFSSAVPTNLTISFFILVVIFTYIRVKFGQMKLKNPTKNEEKFYEENPKFEQFMKKIHFVKERR